MGFRSNGSNGVFVWKPRKLDGNVWENCGKIVENGANVE